jgi:phosphoglycerol transferase MdoB-like AlkP superfamily enzyme
VFLSVAAAAAALLLAGCRRVPPPPYTFAFALEGSSPRLLVATRETTVPLGFVNTGSRTWQPEQIHVSYHWLWCIPREIASRSRWDVPYQNGIRTELGTTIPPGSSVKLEARLLPPPSPGLYWIQWDMVDEGVEWFSQSSPRAERTLVVVLPPPAWIAAPIPFVVALVGLIAARQQRWRYATIADAAWCTACLACKPFIVIHEALLEPTAVAYWLIAVAALLPSILGLLLLPRRVRVWSLVGVGIFGSLLVLGDVVYYRFFGDVLSAPAMLAARQTGHVWGSIRSLLSPILIWIVADWPLAIWLAVRLSRSTQPIPALGHRVAAAASVIAALSLAGVPLSAPRVLASTSFAQTFRDRAVVEQLGLFGFHAFDAWNYARSTWLRRSATDAEIRVAEAWFHDRAALRAGPAAPSFGVARGLNLIVVQVESLQDFVVDLRIEGQDVMPHLRTWSGDALRFRNVTDETNEGRTSDAEFTAMTSLLPLDHGAVAFRYPGNHYAALPRVLAENGYSTLSAVAFEPGFWNRQVMHPAYGFRKSLFEQDFTMTEQIGWGLNDRDFLQQTVPALDTLHQPFAAWLITLSLHHPFDDFPAAYKVLKLGPLEETPIGNYLHTMHFFDEALDAFVRSLDANGLLDKSVVVVFGDHDAGFTRSDSLARTIGIPLGRIAWTMNDRIPLFVRVPASARAGDRRLTGDVVRAAGQTDMAPTLLSILGIDAADLPYVGRNLLAPDLEGPVLRPYGEWIDDHHLFITDGSARSCYAADGSEADPAACVEGDREASRLREISSLVVRSDLQLELRARLAATPEDRK